MPFRANDAAHMMSERARGYLLARELSESQRKLARGSLEAIIENVGPAVEHYPVWHPLVSSHNSNDPLTLPETRCGYRGLDHTIHFLNGFITCPYGDGEDVIESVQKLENDSVAYLSAERLDVKFYHPDATQILVECRWGKPLTRDGTIPLSLALPLLLEKEVPRWREAEVAEPWDVMRPYILGSPHGSRSSLFVNQVTGQGLKKIWNSLMDTGMFGPIRKDSELYM
jgi:hypothetical protein